MHGVTNMAAVNISQNSCCFLLCYRQNPFHFNYKFLKNSDFVLVLVDLFSPAPINTAADTKKTPATRGFVLASGVFHLQNNPRYRLAKYGIY